MSSGREEKHKFGEMDERRMYVKDMSGPVKAIHNLHVDNKGYQGLQEFHKKSSATDLRSPSPCLGRASSANNTVHQNANQSFVQLKEDIVKEIKTELVEPIKNMLSRILDEIQTLKLRTETANACTDASCQTESPGNRYSLAEADMDRAALNELHDLNDQKTDSTENIDLNLPDESNKINEKRLIQSVSDSEISDFLTKDIKNEGSTTVDTKPVPPPNEVHNDTPPALPRPTQMFNFRSKSFQTRGNVVQVMPRPKSEVHQTRANASDKREYLANALQFHIEDLVDGIEFHENDLPDCLVTEGCLTEDECRLVSRICDRKDQTSVIFSLVKGRDLRVLEGFMKHIKHYNPAVAQNIAETFESNMRNGTTHDRARNDDPKKPPPLPKRPSFARKAAVGSVSPQMYSNAKESFTVSNPVSSASMSDLSQAMSSHDWSSHNTPSEHSTENLKVHIPKAYSTTSLPLPGPPTDDKKTMETRNGTPVAGKIPPLPVKKNKHPAWKRADEQGPSYV